MKYLNSNYIIYRHYNPLGVSLLINAQNIKIILLFLGLRDDNWYDYVQNHRNHNNHDYDFQFHVPPIHHSRQAG